MELNGAHHCPVTQLEGTSDSPSAGIPPTQVGAFKHYGRGFSAAGRD